MFRENKKFKLKQRNTKTPVIFHNQNAQKFIDQNKQMKDNRPHSKNLFGNKEKGNIFKLPIKINNKNNMDSNAKKKILKNIEPINIIDSKAKKKFYLEQEDKKFHIRNFSEEKNNKFIFNNNHKKEKIINFNNKNLINNNNLLNNNIVINNLINNNQKNSNNNNIIINHLSRSLKKNNIPQDNKIKFFNLIEENNKKNQNKIYLQNIKKINLHEKEKNENIKNNFPILNNDLKPKIRFLEEGDFKPNNMPNQQNLLKINNPLEIKKKLYINPSNKNKMNIFINNNFKNNKKKVFVRLPETNHINNLININININNNNNFNSNNRYFLKNNDFKKKKKKQNFINNNNLINRENNFLFNKGNNNNNIVRIERSIDDLIKQHKLKNNLIERNNIVARQAVSSGEEPITKNQNLLRNAKKDNNNNENKSNNLKIIRPENNENNCKIIDCCSKENINSHFNVKMEDYTLIKHPFFKMGNNNLSLFAVFDGHGGEDVAKYLKDNYIENLEKSINSNFTSGLTDILRNSIENIDKNIEKLENSRNCGSTGTFVLVNNNNIYCANVGDSKAFYINEKEAIQLTEDHNVKNEKEVDILKSKGVLFVNKRVYGSLSLTRAFGDMDFKEDDGITAIPFIQKIFVNKNNVKYIVIASDGIWDVVNEKILFNISNELKNGTCEEFCNNLINYAIENGSQDNISCVIIKFKY